MRAIEIIERKRDGHALTAEQIRWFISAYAAGDLPDYQAAALLMAIYLRGMTVEETTALTMAMVESGVALSLKDVIPYSVDKHSTGGVGDKTTLALAPTVASLGLPVAKMSGRGLGFSGGTLDKLESIPGFRTALSPAEFRAQVQRIGMVVASQTAELAPADGKLYALRDVTATVGSLPLIASSVMSKKLAGGADAILLDVKVGSGAFVKTLPEAEALAHLMVGIGRQRGRKMGAIISDMHQPLGQAVGNALELAEAIETLHGRGPADFRLLVTTLAGHMLALGDKAATPDEGRQQAERALDDGSAWEKFRQFVIAQGGDARAVDEPARLPHAANVQDVPSPRGGYLHTVSAIAVAETAVKLGAGREKKGQAIDLAVGVICHVKVGQMVRAAEPLFTIHANRADLLEPARHALLGACVWSDSPAPALPLIHRVIA
jgi:pyrimidine-nucleoside phosphorylase